MELIYKGNNERRRKFNEIAAGCLILYAIGESSAYSIKTDHQSADLATGRSQPTRLERLYLETFGIDPDTIGVKQDAKN